MDVRERAIKGLAGLGGYKAVGQAFSWALSVLLARILEPDAYGLMALGVFFVNFFNFVSEFGLSSALIQKKALDDEEVQSAFWLMGAANLVLYVVVAGLAWPVARFYAQPTLAPIIAVLGLNFLVGSVRSIPMCLLARELQFEKSARADLYSHLAGSLGVVSMAVLGLGVWSLVLGSLLQNVLSTVWHLRYRPWRPRQTFAFRRVRNMVTYGVSVNASKILQYVMDNADNLIVGKRFGSRDLGFYNMAFVLGTMPIQKVAPIIFHISFPVFSRLQDDPERSRRYFLVVNRYIGLTALPAMTGLALLADSAVAVLLGSRWAPIVGPLRALCLVGILKALAVTLTPLLYARDQAGRLLRYSAASVAIMPVAFWLGARYGIAGVAMSWAAAYPWLFAYLLALALRELHLPLGAYLRNLAPAAMATLAMSAAVLGVVGGYDGSHAVRLAVGVVLGAATYAGVVVAADRGLLDEVRGALVVLRRKPQAG